jgi:capsular polysaccharide biosynthesis protein
MTTSEPSPGPASPTLTPERLKHDGAAAQFQRPAPGKPGAPQGGRRSKVFTGLTVAALLVLPAAAAAGWSATQPTTYVAEVDLLHEPSDTSSTESIDRQLATHRVLLLRQPMIDDAARFVGLSPDQLAETVDVEVEQASSILRVTVDDKNRTRALRTASFLADRYPAIADEFAASSNIGRVRVVSPPTLLDQPAGPRPTRAAAAGLLVGVLLTLLFLSLVRVRHRSSRHVAP